MYRISQNQLKILTQCPRKYQYIYLDNFASPFTLAEQEKLAWGKKFHLLMQQRELGLPMDSILAENPEMQRCYQALIQTATDLFTPSQPKEDILREAEHSRVLSFDNSLFTVIYDLLIADQNNAKIIDWKSYPIPQNTQKLTRHWQTRLYLFVLVETSDYLPEEVSMTYWFVKPLGNQAPQSLTIPYSQKQHEETKADLKQILHNLTQWLEDYHTQKKPLTQVDINKGICQSCQFVTLCQRTQPSQRENLPNIASPDDVLKNLAIIEEISI
jgi:CRISPR/Cas system-associated exonuclease Cas4 (RecB family)